MTPTNARAEDKFTSTVAVGEFVAQTNDAFEPTPDTGNGNSHCVLPEPADSEIMNLDEEQLKAAIKSSCKKHERLAKKDMGPLFYWLRQKLSAQGSRNDLRDGDEGFGAWVEQNTAYSRRTADRWADRYGLENGLMKRKPKSTSGHVTKCSEEEADDDDEFFERELRAHGRLIQINCWVSQEDHKQYEEALDVIKKHFTIANDKEAVLKGVQYAGESLTHGAGKSQIQVVAGDERKVRDNQAVADPH